MNSLYESLFALDVLCVDIHIVSMVNMKKPTEHVVARGSSDDLCIIPDGCRERILGLSGTETSLRKEHGIILGGISQVVRPYHVRRHNADFCLVAYSLGGHARLTLDDRARDFPRDHVLLAGPHTSYEYAATDNWTLLWFHTYARGGWGPLFPRRAVLRPARWQTPLQQATEGFLQEERHHYPDTGSVFSSYAQLIALLLHRELRGELSQHDSLILRRCEALWKEVGRDPGQPWSLRNMARRVGMSETHLLRVCRALYGLTPMDIVSRRRISRARYLLVTTEETLDSIAAQVGYATGYSLSRAFKRLTGMAPREFRKIQY